MRDDVDLDAAVAAGLIGEDQALALRNLAARQSGISNASVERLEFATGLADLMTAVGLVALGIFALGISVGFPPAALLIIAGIFWAGRRFTPERRMSASAFVTFFAYAVILSMAGMMLGFAIAGRAMPSTPADLHGWPLLFCGVIVTAGCVGWWKWTRFPIAVAAAWIAALNLAANLVRILFPGAPGEAAIWLHLCWGIVLLVVAALWDMTDIRRETVRSRVAFWCHAAAGYFIAHSTLILIAGRGDSAEGWDSLYFAQPADLQAGGVAPFLGVFAVLALLALILDRRSFVFATVYQLFIALTLTTSSVPIAAGGVGLLMIGLAARWQQLRSILLERLPKSIAAQVPRTTLEDEGRRPTRRHVEFGRRRQGSARQDALRG